MMRRRKGMEGGADYFDGCAVRITLNLLEY